MAAERAAALEGLVQTPSIPEAMAAGQASQTSPKSRLSLGASGSLSSIIFMSWASGRRARFQPAKVPAGREDQLPALRFRRLKAAAARQEEAVRAGIPHSPMCLGF